MRLDQAAQPSRIDNISPMSDEANGARHRQRKNVGAPETRPNLLQCNDASGVRGAGKIAGVDRANRRPNHEIRQHSGRQQDAQHAHLYRSKASPTSEDKCGFFSKSIHGRRTFGSLSRIHLLLALLREDTRRGFVTGARIVGGMTSRDQCLPFALDEVLSKKFPDLRCLAASDRDLEVGLAA